MHFLVLIISKEIRSQVINSAFKVGFLHFRDIARSTDERTVISTLIPDGTGNTSPLIFSEVEKDLLFLLGTIISFLF